MAKARMLGYNKPYTPNNRADRKKTNPFTGKRPAAKKTTTKEDPKP